MHTVQRWTLAAMLAAGLAVAGCSDDSSSSSSSSSSGTSWQTVTADDGSYTIEMPGTPKLDKRTSQIPTGEMLMYMQTVAKGSITYTVTRTEYPEGTVTDATDPETIFNGSRDGVVQQMGATITTDEKATISGFPGRTLEFTVDLPRNGGKATMRQSLVLAEGKFYAAQTLVEQERAGSDAADDVNKFHDSFKLVTE